VNGLQATNLRTLAPDSAGKLDVLGHDGDSLGVDGAEIGVLEETNEVRLSSLLQGKDGRALETEIGLEVLGDLSHKALERQLADEKLSGLLVTTDLTKSDSTRTVSVRLLDAAGSRGTLSGSLGGELFSRGLASSRFTSSLFGTSHDVGV
jgi:histone H3